MLYAKRRLAKNNGEFVERTARLVREANGCVATPAGARQISNYRSAPSPAA